MFEQGDKVIIKNLDCLLKDNLLKEAPDLEGVYCNKDMKYVLFSDSQILAEIIYEHGYDVLEEYTGCAVLIMVDYRSLTPEVLMFKGSSCYNENKTKSERPLVYMINEGKLYFSSMYASLYSINCKKNNL